MQIRKSAHADLDTMLAIYAQARKFMEANGNPLQWVNNYPLPELLLQDIAQGSSYVCLDDTGEIIGTFMYFTGDEPTYAKIYHGQWLDHAPYGVIHRIASKGGTQGVAGFCLAWCLQQCKNVRIDTHRSNTPMQNLLKKAGFSYCGIIYLEDGDERLAFQKSML